MTGRERAAALASALDAKLAENINILRIEKLTTLADYFIICTGTSSTHVNTLKEACEMRLDAEGIAPHHVEGYGGGSWVLMDYESVIVHIFTDEARHFYQLDKLWSDAEVISPEDMIEQK